MSSLKKLLSLLTPLEKRRGTSVVGLIIIMAAAEMLGVASIVPFLNVVGNPETIQSTSYLAKLNEMSGLQETKNFIIFLGILAFLAITLSSVVRIVTQYVINRYVNGRRHSLAVRLLAVYLGQPYEFFLHRHSSDIAKTILSEVDGLVVNYLKPAMEMLAHGAVVAVLLALLVITNPIVAVATVIVIGGFYSITFWLVRRKMSRIGSERLLANKARYRSINEASAAIKVVKLTGDEDVFISRFEMPSWQMARYAAQSATLTQVPRYVIETVAIGGVILIVIALMLRTPTDSANSVGDLLPVLGLYAFAGYRMLPSAQQLYSAFSSMRLGRAALDELYSDMQRIPLPPEVAPSEPFQFREMAEMVDVSYQYPGAGRATLENVNLTLRAGQTLGVSGSTGAGKTTLIDILLGLLRPSSGVIKIDGEKLVAGNVRAWQRMLAYVPQEIVLADVSVRENIAFGIPDEEIEQRRVEVAARAASIHDFIDASLGDGYATCVGERGVRLSGGQRQRIGIARALYRQPDLIVLDEATNALDEQTENNVLKGIRELFPYATMVIISHRASTLKRCDQLIEVSEGAVKPSKSMPGMATGD